MTRRIADVWIAAVLFAGNLLILGPFLLTEYSSQPWNNSYVYMAISRMFRDHPWTWNRLQYAGAPFHYLYPPLFHVLTAAMPFVSIGRAFHLVTGCGYALVPVCVYILAAQLFQSRVVAAVAAIAYSVFPSPIYYLLPTWKNLAVPYGNAPWGFVAMVGYEEAAHAFAFSLTLLAITAAWRNRYTLCSVLAGLVFLTNWPALIGLGLALLALAVARTRDLGIVAAVLRVTGVVGVAYGLSAFWMTPGYFTSSTLLNRVVIRHIDAPAPWNGWTALILASALVLVAISFWRRIPSPFALLLVWIAIIGAVVASFSLAGNWLVPMPNRYMLELNAGCILAIAGLVSSVPRRRNAIAGAAVVVGCVASFPFLRQAWGVQPRSVNPQELIAYQTANWLQTHAGSSRVLASGELDSTLALWSDVPQAGGTGQDVSNFLLFAAQRQVIFGCSTNSKEIASLWLRAMNVSYFVVHGPASTEAFHWISRPEKFTGWPIAWDNQAGDVIYKIPDRRDAVVVDLEALHRLPALQSTADQKFLQAYVSWAAGKRPAEVRWEADDRATLEAQLNPGEAILLKSNHDAGWSASGGSLSADPLGFLLIRGAPGRQHFTLRFGASWDVWLGRGITLVTILLLIVRVPAWRIAAMALVPALLAYGVLAQGVPDSARVAEEAFARLQPPLINPGGIVVHGRIVSMYGTSFGSDSARQSAIVWAGDRKTEILYRSPNLISFRLPADAPSKVDVSVEVNGCRGNEFQIEPR